MRIRRAPRLVVLLLAAAIPCLAPVATTTAQEPLRVVTKESPPFAYRSRQAEQWVGISIDLWRLVAERLELSWELVIETTPEAMVAGVAAREHDVAVAALSVTAAREEVVDFSHRYFTAGLGIAVRDEFGRGISGMFQVLFAGPLLLLVGGVVAALLLSGLSFWLVEGHENPQFGDDRKRGVTQGLWWSVIMLLGHKGIFPVTWTGRVLALTTMVTSILLFSVLTGAIASSLTVGQLESRIRGVDDLRHVRTLAVDGTSAAEYLRRERIAYTVCADVRAGLDAVGARLADALVHDAPLLEYEVRDRDDAVRVLPVSFEQQDYAIAVPQGSALRERINGALLELRSSPDFERILERYR